MRIVLDTNLWSYIANKSEAAAFEKLFVGGISRSYCLVDAA